MKLKSPTGKYGPENTPYLDTFHAVIWSQYFAHTDSTIRIYLWVGHCKLQQPGYYDFGTLTFSNYVKQSLDLLGTGLL